MEKKIENPPLPKASRQMPVTSDQLPVASGQQPAARCQMPDASLRRATLGLSSSRRQPSCNRLFIVPVFLPHAGCPHRCIFCNQSSITGTRSTPECKDIHRHIDTFLNFRHKQRRFVQIAFFGGNFFGIQTPTMKRLLALATQYITAGQAHSIRFSTRPDTITRQRLASIKDFPVSTIELGVQSMDDNVLKRSNRGHTAADTIKAVQLLREFGYEVGVQLMVGLPGDDVQCLQTSARKIARLKPDFIRIYPTVVLSGSPLATLYKKGIYVPLSLAEAVSQTKELYLLFKGENIRVIRMGLQASEDLQNGSTILAGPYHPAFGHLVYGKMFLDMAVLAIKSKNLKEDSVVLHVHPRSVSKMRGQRNENIKTLCGKLHLQSIDVVADESLRQDQLKVSALSRNSDKVSPAFLNYR
ncbi:MAG: radical SAM protein [Desulfobacterales bacterium]|jgi:histone acetyltransferase (RNA polymerase elongator complex component)